MDAAQALADLTEISSQIQAAVILDGDGSIVASTLDDSRARELAEATQELLAKVRTSAGSDRELAQLEVSTAAGSVFLVRDGSRTIAATTGPEPTVGLVFYDLKSCLRSAAGAEKPAPKPRARRQKEKAETDAPA
ncbi:MAG TPA: roadblock/LC7 domain-containing protein [Gaiellaceae bacterium]|nr:roadblock/LC7 domain-containing protein [Gaiellaceae bacterium]